MKTVLQVGEAVMAGKLMCGAEWRSSKAGMASIEDERTKVKKVTKAIVHQVEIEGMPFEIREEIAKDQIEAFNVDLYNDKPRPFKRGEMVVIHMKSFGWSMKKSRYIGKGHPESVTFK